MGGDERGREGVGERGKGVRGDGGWGEDGVEVVWEEGCEGGEVDSGKEWGDVREMHIMV